MKNATLTAPARPLVARRTLIDNWARRIVVRALDRLEGGTILLEDEERTVGIGRGDDLVGSVRVHHPDFYRRLLFGGGLGAAESYIDGGWSTSDLSTVLRIFARDESLSSRLDDGWAAWRSFRERAFHRLRKNTVSGSAGNIHAHYDLGNTFFSLFLDETMNYSAGVFEHREASMRDASVAKMDRACRKLDLRPNDHLLEIGTGWGALAVHAASHYGCRVTTTTISSEQFARAAARVREAGLSSKVTVLRADYRQLEGTFDKAVSIEMIEAVGDDYLDRFFERCCRLLRPEGLMLLQAIVTPEHRHRASLESVDFIRRYIFPGSSLVSVGRMATAIGRTGDFRILDVEDIGPHYAETLRRWRDGFLASLDDIRALGFDDRFIRMWEYYLSYSEAGFEERIVGDVQMLLARPANRRPMLVEQPVSLPWPAR